MGFQCSRNHYMLQLEKVTSRCKNYLQIIAGCIIIYPAQGDIAQLVRALRSHRRGQGFEPLYPHQTKNAACAAFFFILPCIAQFGISMEYQSLRVLLIKTAVFA